MEKNQVFPLTLTQLLFLFNYIRCLTQAEEGRNQVMFTFFMRKLEVFTENSLKMSDEEYEKFHSMLNQTRLQINEQYDAFLAGVKKHASAVSDDLSMALISLDDQILSNNLEDILKNGEVEPIISSSKFGINIEN